MKKRYCPIIDKIALILSFLFCMKKVWNELSDKELADSQKIFRLLLTPF